MSKRSGRKTKDDDVGNMSGSNLALHKTMKFEMKLLEDKKRIWTCNMFSIKIEQIHGESARNLELYKGIDPKNGYRPTVASLFDSYQFG
jgi:hypothetical protein